MTTNANPVLWMVVEKLPWGECCLARGLSKARAARVQRAHGGTVRVDVGQEVK